MARYQIHFSLWNINTSPSIFCDTGKSQALKVLELAKRSIDQLLLDMCTRLEYDTRTLGTLVVSQKMLDLAKVEQFEQT